MGMVCSVLYVVICLIVPVEVAYDYLDRSEEATVHVILKLVDSRFFQCNASTLRHLEQSWSSRKILVWECIRKRSIESLSIRKLRNVSRQAGFSHDKALTALSMGKFKQEALFANSASDGTDAEERERKIDSRLRRQITVAIVVCSEFFG